MHVVIDIFKLYAGIPQNVNAIYVKQKTVFKYVCSAFVQHLHKRMSSCFQTFCFLHMKVI